MRSPREVTGSPVYQGEDESITYTFDWSAVGTPTSPVVALKDPQGRDKSSVNLGGSASVVGDAVITPLVTGLIKENVYRLECQVTKDGQVYEAYCRIIAEE